MGAYTLDIYLIQIIFLVERILGPLYRQNIGISGVDYLHLYGLFSEIIATFLLAFILLECIIWISRLLNKVSLFAFIL